MGFFDRKPKAPEKWPGGDMETGEGFASIKWNHGCLRVLSLEHEWSYADLEAHLAAGWRVVSTYIYGTNGYGGDPAYRIMLYKPQ